MSSLEQLHVQIELLRLARLGTIFVGLDSENQLNTLFGQTKSVELKLSSIPGAR